MMPKVSIITVNLNNAEGLEATMNSVFGQDFNDLEYIVIDGDSTDDSKAIIAANAGKISYWVSEKDKGVYSAMNKGIVRASGEYLLFMNSGDYFYSTDALSKLLKDSDGKDLIYGNMMLDEAGNLTRQSYQAELSFDYFFQGFSLPHHATLIHKKLFTRTGLYNESFKIVSDWEFFINAVCLHQASYQYVNADIAVFRMDGMSSRPENVHYYAEERAQTYQKYYKAFFTLLERDQQQQRDLRLLKSSRLHRLATTVSSLVKRKRS